MNHNISPYAWPGIACYNHVEIMQVEIMPIDVIEAVCDVLRMPAIALKERTRRRRIAQARWICWLLVKRFCRDVSLKEMGQMFGRYDHTTVMHGLRVIVDDMAQDEILNHHVESIAARIKNNQ